MSTRLERTRLRLVPPPPPKAEEVETRRRRLGRFLPRPPAPLAALMAVVVILGMAWSLFVPSGQSPDEPAHLAYVQILAEQLRTPEPDFVPRRESGYSTEQRLARDRAHEQWQYAEPEVKSVWTPNTERRWRAEEARLRPRARSDGGGPNSAAGNPPLYYAYEALAYHAAGGTWLDRLFAMRIWSALLLAASVAATWLLVGELTARDRLAQLVAAGVVGLQPMASFITASVNPDAGLVPLWALAFWLGVRVLRGPASRGLVAALLAITALALLTKASSLALLPPVAFVLAVVARRALRGHGVPSRWVALFAGAGVLVVGLAAVAASGRLGNALRFRPGDVVGFADYMWQAYFPNLPFQTPIPNLAAAEGFEIWIRTGWAAFGWLEIQFPDPVYWLLFVVSAALVAAGALAVWRQRFPIDGAVIAFFVIAVLGFLLGVHWAEYRQFAAEGESFIQGRYLLPLLPIGGILTAAGLANLPARWRGLGTAAALGGLFALQVFSLGLVAVRFYV
jgi:4-amino-4-deoxy-L-arabinose transferase-like glycosyltransferase